MRVWLAAAILVLLGSAAVAYALGPLVRWQVLKARGQSAVGTVLRSERRLQATPWDRSQHAGCILELRYEGPNGQAHRARAVIPDRRQCDGALDAGALVALRYRPEAPEEPMLERSRAAFPAGRHEVALSVGLFVALGGVALALARVAGWPGHVAGTARRRARRV
jgi:hypothetical protein